MIKHSVVKIQNLIMNHESRPVKSNPVSTFKSLSLSNSYILFSPAVCGSFLTYMLYIFLFFHLFFDSFCLSCLYSFFCLGLSQFKIFGSHFPIFNFSSKLFFYHGKCIFSLLIHVSHSVSPLFFTSW